MALIVASVPLFTILTFSTEGTNSVIIFAILISSSVGAPKLVPISKAFKSASLIKGGLCPNKCGPQLPIYSMYSFPSTSQNFDPTPQLINKGSPPTDLNARTGEFTPPGIYFFASVKNCLLFSKFITFPKF